MIKNQDDIKYTQHIQDQLEGPGLLWNVEQIEDIP